MKITTSTSPGAATRSPRRQFMIGAAAMTAALLPGACTNTSRSTPRSESPRVVALGYIKDADATLAAHIAPVGIPKPSGLSDTEPWTLAALDALDQGTPETLEVDTEAPLEQIAALEPDLIVATGFYAIDRLEDQLEQIADVLLPVTGPNIDPWKETARRVGQALESESVALEEIARTEDAVREASDRYPQLAGKTFTYSSYSKGVFWTKNSPDDVIVQGLSAYGMSLAPAVSGLPSAHAAGLAEISAEHVGLLDADITIVLARSEDERRTIEAVPLFGQLGSVRRGSYLPVGSAHGNALAFPSVLSVRYAAANVAPRLAAAAR